MISLVLCCFLVAQGQAAPQFPALTSRVVDKAKLLSADAVGALTSKLADLEQRTGRQLVVVTLPSLQGYEIEEFGYQLGRAWRLGQKTLNDGALFIIAPKERRVRIEVGYGLEGVITDALSSVIIQQKVLPHFRDDNMQAGILAGADAIIEQLLLDAPEAKARVAAAEKQAAEPEFNPVVLLFIAFIIFSVLGRAFGGRRGGAAAALPWIILGGLGGRRGGGFGGGGFGGGGGSFGGGGASGRW